MEAGAQIGFHMEGTVLLLLNLRDDFAQVIDRLEGMILLQQVFSQLSRRVHRNSRNIVNWLLGVELHALAAHIPKRIHHVAFHLQKTEFENLKQPDRTSTDDNDVCFNDFVSPLCNGQVIFNSHFC